MSRGSEPGGDVGPFGTKWEEVYLSRVGTNGVVIGRQDPATVTRIKDEFDRLVARYAVDAGQVALPAVAVLGSGQRAADRAG